MSKVRRCDSRCHNAKGQRCRCWCGGHFHGAAGTVNRESFSKAVDEAAQLQLLKENGFQEGMTKFVMQVPMLSEVTGADHV